jgi:nucleoid DNA-binding protein
MRVDGAFVQPFMDFSRSLDRELSELLVQSLLKRMRHALLEGHTLEAPGIGEFTVRQRNPYALVNPTSGQTAELGGERVILFRPDKQLLRDLNAAREDDDVD